MEDFVTFNIAKKLKEFGFNQSCINAINSYGCTYLNGWLEYLSDNIRYNGCYDVDDIFFKQCDLKDGDYLLPNIYQVMKWLRDEKHILITPYSQSMESWQYRITVPHQQLQDGIFGEDFASYEDAVMDAIDYVVNKMLI